MRHFLLVDDNPTFAALLKKSFDRRGLTLSWAADGMAAQARAPGSDGIILDLNLEGESGLQLLPALRRQCPRIPVVVLTGYASISTAVAAVKLGATQYLPKPADVETILAAFNEPGQPTAPAAEELVAFQPSVRKQSWEYVQFVLQQHGGNISAASRAPGMHRRTLQRMLQKKPVAR